MRRTWGWALAVALTAMCAHGAQAADKPKDRTVGLARVVYRIDDGEVWGHINCQEQTRTLRWDRETSEVSVEHLSEVFNRVLRAESGVERVENLFEDQVADPQLQVAAAITEIHAGLCPSYGDASGSLSMTVEWQVFDPAQRKVVAKVETRGDAHLENATGGLDYLLKAAFQDNARDLTSDPTFQRARKASAGDAARPDPSASIHFISAQTDAPHTPAQAVDSVVLVQTSDGHGSGFLISKEGYVLTNRHVVGAAHIVRVHWADGSDTAGTVVRSDPHRDVALVKTDARGVPPLRLRHGLPPQGETVFAIGAPMNTNLQGTLTRGIVSATRERDGMQFIQSDVSVTHGNSGGPLMNERAEVLGMTAMTATPDGAFLGLNLFIPIDDALRTLALEPEAPVEPPRAAPRLSSHHPSAHR
jgi:S1-C subfamily serine protease